MGEPSQLQPRPSITPLGPTLPLRLQRFTLCAELGAGGMATVYLARMQLAAGLERLVALKTIHPHLAKEKPFVDMFLDEAKIASHVGHPNVCATYDFGEADGVYYLAMEYLLGEPLFDVINRMVDRFEDVREVLPFLAARVVADACEGIHAAHAARGPDGELLHIVHRDVSPQNLFLTYDGSTKVVDFGCAKAAERVAHTSTGVMKGKVGYAAPEQLRNDHVDSRADIWALGVCLWETLALSPLFSRGTAVKTAMAVLKDPIELASNGRDWVPDEVAQIAAKALQRDRELRYGSARELGRALRTFIANSGFSLESAELAEWMGFLFEGKLEKRMKQASEVSEMDLSGARSGPLNELTDADVEALESDVAPLIAVPLGEDDRPLYDNERASGSVDKRTADYDDDVVDLPMAQSRPWMWIGLLVLLAAIFGGIYFANNGTPPWLTELIGNGPAASTPESDVDDESDAPILHPPSLTGDRDEENDEADEEGAPEEEIEPESEEEAAAPAPREDRRRRARSRRGGGATSRATDSTQTTGGFLTITASNGWATVFAGTRSLGRTPIHAQLPAGRYPLRILPFGRGPGQSMSVTIEPGLEESMTIDVGDES